MVVIRLSEKKIHVKCKMEIRTSPNANSETILVDEIDTRLVYRKNDVYNLSTSRTETVYQVIIKPGFIASLCNKYGIKKKYVAFLGIDNTKFNIAVDDNVLFENYYIYFADPEWYIRWNREQKLKELNI